MPGVLRQVLDDISGSKVVPGHSSKMGITNSVFFLGYNEPLKVRC